MTRPAHPAAAGALLAALLLGACATVPVTPPPALPQAREAGRPPTAGQEPFEKTVARFTDLAVQQERGGDLRGALASWRVIAALRPGNAEWQRRAAELAEHLRKEADRRYQQGMARLQEGATDAARKELLLALAADPDHAQALASLKNDIEPDAVPYTTAAGDTLESIAQRTYNEPGKALLIARLNDLDPKSRPAPGTVLSLPVIGRTAPAAGGPKAGEAVPAEPRDAAEEGEPASAAPPVEVAPAPTADTAELQLANAAELSGRQRYAEAILVAEKLTGHAAVGAKARRLVSDAWFGIGDGALKEDRLHEATEAYRKADPALKDVPAALAAVERRKKEKAEEAYNEGVRFFINQKLDEAIRSWEATLALNPQHPKAAKDIEKARDLQQKLNQIR